NWCPVSQTGLSDEEVIMKPSKGSLYRMRYEVAELPGTFLEISTTRPETIPGDAAVAVHPEDERYKHLIGKHVWRPFPRAQIPIVGDAAVEKEFGTGVLKVTPAHDRTDFDIGKRHDLPVIDVMNPDGTMNADAGPLAGVERFKARAMAEKLLEELGALVKTEPYENTVGFSERADVPIEPRLSEQWFIRYPKIDEAKRAVTAGIIKFHPERWTKTYLHWLENIQDWCVSRQLWWGHRIPVWYRKGADRNDPKNLHVSLAAPADAANWEQDPDVLDTWASSWLWCLATIGWRKPGETTEELKHWYPTGALATGPDIIFLWVARMIIAGLELHGPEKKTLTDDEIRQRVPFKRVYFNGIIRDKLGRKMSKSLGNSPEPLDLIAKFGADGLRFGLLSIAPKGQDILFDEDRVAQGRNFCNKLWNAARFRQMSGPMADNSTLDARRRRRPHQGRAAGRRRFRDPPRPRRTDRQHDEEPRGARVHGLRPRTLLLLLGRLLRLVCRSLQGPPERPGARRQLPRRPGPGAASVPAAAPPGGAFHLRRAVASAGLRRRERLHPGSSYGIRRRPAARAPGKRHQAQRGQGGGRGPPARVRRFRPRTQVPGQPGDPTRFGHHGRRQGRRGQSPPLGQPGEAQQHGRPRRARLRRLRGRPHRFAHLAGHGPARTLRHGRRRRREGPPGQGTRQARTGGRRRRSQAHERGVRLQGPAEDPRRSPQAARRSQGQARRDRAHAHDARLK
ncbi:MAG: hypothetical protein EBR95_04875, partial [Verrucomicrobia bacterium]|nr:hypothetical protein [Verrucomicrobiota bacterium]